MRTATDDTAKGQVGHEGLQETPPFVRAATNTLESEIGGFGRTKALPTETHGSADAAVREESAGARHFGEMWIEIVAALGQAAGATESDRPTESAVGRRVFAVGGIVGIVFCQRTTG